MTESQDPAGIERLQEERVAIGQEAVKAQAVRHCLSVLDPQAPRSSHDYQVLLRQLEEVVAKELSQGEGQSTQNTQEG